MATGTEQEIKPAPLNSETGEHIYPMSREGKRQAYILLAGVASIWIFAVWTLITIFQDGVSGVEWVSMLLMLGMIIVAPVVGWTLLEEASSRIETGNQGIRYRSMGGIDLRYEWGEVSGPKPKGPSRLARFFLGDDDAQPGTDDKNNNVSNVEASELRPEVNQQNGRAQNSVSDTATERVDETDGEADVGEDGVPETILLVVPDHSEQIANPVSKFLHKQAHGSTLPVYGGMERFPDLVSEIERHVPGMIASNPVPALQPQVEVPPADS